MSYKKLKENQKYTQSLIEELDTTIKKRGHRDESGIVYFMLSFFDHLPAPAWIKTIDEHDNIRIIRVNKEYERVYGLSTAEALKRENDELLPEVLKWNENDLEVINKNKAGIFNEEVTLPDGTITPIEVHKWPLQGFLEGKGVCGMAYHTEEH